MNDQEIVRYLQGRYPGYVERCARFPKPWIGLQSINAIIVGADPSNFKGPKKLRFDHVFGLENLKSTHFRAVKGNLHCLENLSLETVHIEYLCPNYFRKPLCDNPHWLEIAHDFWAPRLREKLDALYKQDTPVLVTSEYVMKALMVDPDRMPEANMLYKKHQVISPEDNLLGRRLYAFYRQWRYSLSAFPKYTAWLDGEIVGSLVDTAGAA